MAIPDLNNGYEGDNIQPRYTSLASVKGGAAVDIGNLMSWFGQHLPTIPTWWSPQRDAYLRNFWKSSEVLSGILYVIQTRLVSIPYRIIPLNPNIQEHSDIAQMFRYNLDVYSEWGQGFEVAYSKFIEDVLTQDNGGFLYVMGNKPSWESLKGSYAVGVKHLDAARCTHTNNPMFPVIYDNPEVTDPQEDSRQPIHWERIISLVLQPSPDSDMCGVGYCAISRTLQSAQKIMSIAQYYEEKLGSRPLRAILAVNGIEDKQLAKAIARQEMANDNAHLSRFSKIMALASIDSKLDVKLTDLASLPDGFDEEVSTKIAMYVMANGFGVDIREIYAATEAGATRADAVITNLKARGKTFGYITRFMERQLRLKVLAPFLTLNFDSIDDEQDKLTTELRQLRATYRGLDLTSGMANMRTVREFALRDGDYTEAQFNYDELQDGRLPDGTNVLSLFQSKDATYKDMLNLTVENPLDYRKNNPETMITNIERQEQYISDIMINTNIVNKKIAGQRALMALKTLRQFYGAMPSPYQVYDGAITNAVPTLEETPEEGEESPKSPNQEVNPSITAMNFNEPMDEATRE